MTNNHPLAWHTVDGPKQDQRSPAFHMARHAEREASMMRMWINQPSSLQPHHNLHGTNVLYDGKTETTYFLSGAVVSSMLAPNTLSRGWITKEK